MHNRVHNELASACSGSHSLWLHSNFSEPIKSFNDFARLAGIDSTRIAKTVLLANRKRNKDKIEISNFAAAFLPAVEKVDMAIIKEMMGWSGVEMASISELKKLTDYPPNGVSPIGISEIPIYTYDNFYNDNDTVFIGSGDAGEEIEIDWGSLKRIVYFSYLP